MHYPEETEKKDNIDTTEQQKLVLDGTANLDYSDDEQVPRVKGLIQLLNLYFGRNRDINP